MVAPLVVVMVVVLVVVVVFDGFSARIKFAQHQAPLDDDDGQGLYSRKIRITYS